MSAPNPDGFLYHGIIVNAPSPEVAYLQRGFDLIAGCLQNNASASLSPLERQARHLAKLSKGSGRYEHDSVFRAAVNDVLELTEGAK